MKLVLRSLAPLFLLSTLSIGCSHHGQHHGKSPHDFPETVSVSGDGEAKGRPDRVRLTLGVESKNESLDVAMADATKRINGLREALLKVGVAEEDMKTGQLSIGNYREPITVHVPQTAPASVPMEKGKAIPAPPAPMVTEERWVDRFVVSTNFEVVFKNVEKTGELVKAAVGAGANQSWGIQFEIAEPKPLEDQARTAAIADAKRRAEQLATESGVKLGRVLSITEGGNFQGPVPMPMYRASGALKMAESAPMSIEGGQTVVRSSVSIVYAIEN